MSTLAEVLEAIRAMDGHVAEALARPSVPRPTRHRAAPGNRPPSAGPGLASLAVPAVQAARPFLGPASPGLGEAIHAMGGLVAALAHLSEVLSGKPPVVQAAQPPAPQPTRQRPGGRRQAAPRGQPPASTAPASPVPAKPLWTPPPTVIHYPAPPAPPKPPDPNVYQLQQPSALPPQPANPNVYPLAPPQQQAQPAPPPVRTPPPPVYGLAPPAPPPPPPGGVLPPGAPIPPPVPGGAAGGAAAGAAGAIGLGIAAGLVIAALVKLGTAMIDFTKGLSDANRALAEFSPSMALVNAQANVREAQRDFRQGERTAGTAGFMENAWQGLKDDFAEIGTLVRNLFNVITGSLVWVIRGALAGITLIATVVNKLFEWLQKRFGGGPEGETIMLSQWMQQVQEEVDRAKRRNDPRFKHPRRTEEEAMR